MIVDKSKELIIQLIDDSINDEKNPRITALRNEIKDHLYHDCRNLLTLQNVEFDDTELLEHVDRVLQNHFKMSVNFCIRMCVVELLGWLTEQSKS